MKKYTIIPIFLAVGILAAGCKKNDEGNAGNTPAPESAQTEYVMQDSDIQIVGEVTEIVGNEVTLALGDVSENNSAPEFSDNENMPDREDLPQMGGDEEPSQRKRGEGFSQMENGEGFPQMGDGEDFRQRGNEDGSPKMGDSNDFSQSEKRGRGNRSSASIEKSGETGSYIIPVGMTVIGASGRNNDYSAVSAGMILQLTVNSEGYVVAAEIL